MRPCLAFAFLFFSFMTQAFATDNAVSLRQAVQAFEAANFLRAADLARNIGSPEGDAYAARAELVYADFVSPPEERLKIVLQAEKDARRAIALAPDFAEGRLQLAIALGFRARWEGYMTAHFEGLADEARAHLDRVIEREPNNPWAHALLGGWHLEIAKAGGFIGRTIYGASVETGMAEYERALALKPGDLVVSAQCALQLAALGDASDREQALTIISEIKAPETPDAFHRLTLKRLRDLETVLQGGDEAAIAQLVRIQKGLSNADAPAGVNRGVRLIPRSGHQAYAKPGRVH